MGVEGSFHAIETDDAIYHVIQQDTLELFRIKSKEKVYTIPKYVIYKKKKFYPIKINALAFYGSNDVETLIFPFDSSIQFFSPSSFSFPSIKSIVFSSALKHFPGISSSNLRTVIFPQNENFIVNHDQCLYDKSGRNLLFVPRNKRFMIVREIISLIGQYAFAATSIKSICLPKSIKKIGNAAFSGCRNLRYIKIQDGVSHIGEYAFSHCTLLHSLKIPKSVLNLGEHCFAMSSIYYLHFHEESTIETLPYEMCGGCNNLCSMKIPSSVTIIDAKCFDNCFHLYKVEIKANSRLKHIRINAFRSTGLKYITLPSTISSIRLDAFNEKTQILSRNIDSLYIIGSDHIARDYSIVVSKTTKIYGDLDFLKKIIVD